MTRVLFLSSRNACRGPIVFAFARALKPDAVEVIAAGVETAELYPATTRVLGEAGLDLSGWEPHALADLGAAEFDVVVTLSEEAAAACPVLPGHPTRIDWNLADPHAVTGDEAQVLRAFQTMRDEARRLVSDFFKRGYCAALAASKNCQNLVLNSLSEGIVAHDLDRRIFFFNDAAERITGYLREEVINRDCHDVFEGGMCGGKCLFDGDRPPQFDALRRELHIITKDGEKRAVSMGLRRIADTAGKPVGVVGSLLDRTRERYLERRAGEVNQFAGIVGADPKMLELFDLIQELTDTNAPVLIHGESGTGKELVSAAIHNEGPRAKRLFVPVNCGALPEHLLESELFGHVKGAFTGAIRDKKGRFELADGGTIFLDEIGDVTPAMQVRLLRVLQEGCFERVGSETTIQVDVRVISATNKDLAQEIEEGRFREDLYYRLNVVPIYLPPVRERRSDIPALMDHILKNLAETPQLSGVSFSAATREIMIGYDWPGNVREMQNWIQYALVKCRGGVIQPEHLPPIRGGASRGTRRRRKLDVDSVRQALEQSKGNKVEAARLLGVSRATLYRFLTDAGFTL